MGGGRASKIGVRPDSQVHNLNPILANVTDWILEAATRWTPCSLIRRHTSSCSASSSASTSHVPRQSSTALPQPHRCHPQRSGADTKSAHPATRRHLQNNPPLNVPKEDLASEHVLAALEPYTTAKGGPLLVRSRSVQTLAGAAPDILSAPPRRGRSPATRRALPAPATRHPMRAYLTRHVTLVGVRRLSRAAAT